MLTFHFDLVIMNKNRGVIPDFSRERIMIIMKKTLSIVLALAMVFVMGFSAFAEGEDLAPVKPTDPAELGVYYAELLNAEDSDPAAVAQMVLDDLIIAEGDEGIYTVEDLPVVLEAFVENSNDADKLLAAVEQIEAGLESMGIVLPEIDLDYIEIISIRRYCKYLAQIGYDTEKIEEIKKSHGIKIKRK